jgi:hypothetical protein
VVRVPIACSLPAAAADDRIDEWRRFLAASVDAAERTSPQQLRMHLTSTTVLAAAVDLAQREKSCCDFFEFEIAIESHALWLSVQVPAEATPVLDDFARLLPNES